MMSNADGQDNVSAFGPKEAASRLSIGRTTLYKLLGAGKLRAIKCESRTLILSSEIDRFLASLPAFGGEK